MPLELCTMEASADSLRQFQMTMSQAGGDAFGVADATGRRGRESLEGQREVEGSKVVGQRQMMFRGTDSTVRQALERSLSGDAGWMGIVAQAARIPLNPACVAIARSPEQAASPDSPHTPCTLLRALTLIDHQPAPRVNTSGVRVELRTYHCAHCATVQTTVHSCTFCRSSLPRSTLAQYTTLLCSSPGPGIEMVENSNEKRCPPRLLDPPASRGLDLIPFPTPRYGREKSTQLLYGDNCTSSRSWKTIDRAMFAVGRDNINLHMAAARLCPAD
nr:hypothetical protein CFP56_68379 [Quercus suber]